MPTQKSNTKVVTGIVRLSYEHVWEPASINGSNPKYSVSLIIPKSDTKTIAAINAAVDAAIKDYRRHQGGCGEVRREGAAQGRSEAAPPGRRRRAG